MSRKTIAGGLMVLAALAGLVWAGRLLLPKIEPALPAGTIQVLVQTPGMVVLTAADLQQFGWSDVDPGALRLENLGEPVPLFSEGEGDGLRLYFSGLPPPAPFDRYTRENVYVLSRGDPSSGRLEIEPAESAADSPADVQTSYSADLTLEENRLYVPEFIEGQAWFWQQLAAPADLDVVFELDALAGQGWLVVELYGRTASDETDPDHHIVVELNGDMIADVTWDGAGLKTIEIANVPFAAGENTLRLIAPGDTGVLADIVLLDRIAITTPRLFRPDPGGLQFVAASDAIRLDEAQDADAAYLFDLTENSAVRLAAGPEMLGQTSVGHTYSLVLDGGFNAPARLRAGSAPRDWSAEAGAEYLAIGDPALLEALGPLLERREEQGLSTLAVPLQDVYDRFSGGLATPHAIRDFLRFAVENWPDPPRYVVLVGDWSYDPLGHLSEPEEDWLPSFFVFTEYGGETVSDVEFAQLDEDRLPDLALGRIPARTPEQVRVLVEKTLAFEEAAPGAWSGRLLAVADGTEESFARDAQHFLDLFPEGYEPIVLVPPAGSEDAHLDIEAEIEAGVLLFSYFGHGSIVQLGKDGLFTTEHAAGLQNGSLAPLMLNITCLAGLFTHPTIESLSEAMLWNAGGGAVASLGATSLTLPVYQAYLSSGLAENLVAQPGGRLGDVLLAAQRAMPVDLGRGLTEVLDTFILFGDPALVLPER